jgi:hypothetical protein
MDASDYFRLSGALAAARSHEDLASVRDRVNPAPVHSRDRGVLERVLRSRADTLRLRDIAAAGNRARWVG